MKQQYTIRLSVIESATCTFSSSFTLTLLTIFVFGLLVITPVPAFSAVKSVPVLASDIASINASITGTMVEVKATIKTITSPPEGSRQPFKVTLTDDKSAITLIIWRDVWVALDKQYSPTNGDAVEVRALVTVYRNQVQLTLKDITDIHIPSKAPAGVSAAEAPAAGNSNAPSAGAGPLVQPGADLTSNALPASANTSTSASATAAPTPLSKVSLSMKGQKIIVQGAVTAVRDPSSERAPYIVTLSDGPTNIKLVYWKNIQTEVGPMVHTGNTIRAKVTVDEYHNALELVLNDPKGVEVVGSPAAK